MAQELGELYVGVRCKNCGPHREGKPASNGRTRCRRCGRFGEELTDYCVEHDTSYASLPGDGCPLCRERDRIKQQEMEMHQRRADPQMHPTVDAPRY